MSVSPSVFLLVHKVYCGKTADWIRMSFGEVSGVNPGIHLLDGVHMPQEEGVVCSIGIFCNRNVLDSCE